MSVQKNKKIIIANWKMNPGTITIAEKLFKGIKKGSMKGVDTVVCAPFPYLTIIKKNKPSAFCALGVQNIHHEKEGAHTGEVSLSMLASFPVKYAIVGHSERRAQGETNQIIAQKIGLLIKAKITPVLCVGEKERDHSGFYLHTIKEQLIECLSLIPKASYKNIVIAYEPLWAIGKDAARPATPEESNEMVIFIRKCVSDIAGSTVAHQMRVIYGGSVSSKDASVFLREGGVDGFLVGRASLDIKEFTKIIALAGAQK